MNRFIPAFILLILLNGCGEPAEVSQKPQPVRPVITMQVLEPSATIEKSFSGTASAAIETMLSFRVPGEIEKLNAHIGMLVKQGDLIAQLDASDYRLGVEQLEAVLQQVEAQLKNAAAEYERIESLYQSGNVSRSAYDKVKAGFEAARAQQQATIKNLTLARKKLSYCTLTSPENGRIGAVPAEVHQTVSAGMPVAILTTSDNMEMEIGLPDAFINQVEVGDEAVISFDAIPGKLYSATISEVGATINRSTAYPVKLRIDNRDGLVRSGMVGEATLKLAPLFGAGALVVDPAAVFADSQGGRFVWLVEGDQARKQAVRIGKISSSGLEIIEGIKPGDTVVIRGVHHLKEGQRLLREQS